MAYDMRSALPAFGSLGGLPGLQQALGASSLAGSTASGLSPYEQLLATLFPQFMSAQPGPQYGRHAPDWRNTWAMDAQGYGMPVAAGTAPWATAQEHRNGKPIDAPATAVMDTALPWLGGDYIWHGFGGSE
jgi:hypothetical protein